MVVVSSAAGFQAFFMIMFLFVVSAVHVVFRMITPSAKCSIVVSSCLSCMPSVKRIKWHSSIFWFSAVKH
jgi:hypothetical protein